MNAVCASVGVTALPSWLAELSVSLGWDWGDWAWGWCGEFAELGMAAFALGPMLIQIDWPIS
jgi:hypothetical protein